MVDVAIDGQRQGAHTAENAAMYESVRQALGDHCCTKEDDFRGAVWALDTLLARVEAANEKVEQLQRACNTEVRVCSARTRMLQTSERQVAVLGERVVALETEGARLRRALRLIRKRTLHNASQAAESLMVWVLNGNDPDEWSPAPADFGYADELSFRRRVRVNRDIGADSSAPLDYLPVCALAQSEGLPPPPLDTPAKEDA